MEKNTDWSILTADESAAITEALLSGYGSAVAQEELFDAFAIVGREMIRAKVGMAMLEMIVEGRVDLKIEGDSFTIRNRKES